MRSAVILIIMCVISALMVSCTGKFDGTVWECNYDYKEYQDHMVGINQIEFLPDSRIRGTFSNPGLPPSVYMFDYTISGGKITCVNPDIEDRVFIIEGDKILSEDGRCIYVKKEAQPAGGKQENSRD